MPDPENQAREGKVLSASGTRHLIFNISGDRQVSDVSCSCGVQAVKGSFLACRSCSVTLRCGPLPAQIRASSELVSPVQHLADKGLCRTTTS